MPPAEAPDIARSAELRDPDAAPLPDVARRVVAWQRLHGRHGLPWQGTRDPYRVWLSEVMLQQTQVSTVLDYYGRFLERFADVGALAAAPLDEVLALWSGLGYYSRARNLHRCAQAVVRDHGGQFPGTARELAALPGIGRSTAAAIAAFCFGERVAILDGNVRRVLARVLGFDGDLAQARQVDRLWEQAERLLPSSEDVAPYTQGLMDLGAMRCHRRRPACGDCPLAEVCAARTTGDVERLPVRSRALRRQSWQNALLWLRHRERVWLVQRPSVGVWAGLWTLPAWEQAEALAAQVAGWPGRGEVLPSVRHVLTHADWRLDPLRWTLPDDLLPGTLAAIEAQLPAGRWVGEADHPQVGLPAPIRRLLAGPPPAEAPGAA